MGSRAGFFAWKEMLQLVYGSSLYFSSEGVPVVKLVQLAVFKLGVLHLVKMLLTRTSI